MARICSKHLKYELTSSTEYKEQFRCYVCCPLFMHCTFKDALIQFEHKRLKKKVLTIHLSTTNKKVISMLAHLFSLQLTISSFIQKVLFYNLDFKNIVTL